MVCGGCDDLPTPESERDMRVGFTGTRNGMTEQQVSVFKDAIRFIGVENVTEFHQGCCVGADEQAVLAMLDLGFPGDKIWAHLPENKSKIFKFHKGLENIRIVQPKPYLERNKNIVERSDVLLAAPESGTEILRSGTWSTVRAGRVKKMPIKIILPSGLTI